jgi:6-phosphogluconolactonase
MKQNIKIFDTPINLAKSFAEEMVRMITEKTRVKKTFTIALSGGTTPEIIFSVLSNDFPGSVAWQNVHFFWGDERCVPPSDSESNFRMAYEKLLSKINIPSVNIHRIAGENIPEIEAIRYSEEISDFTEKRDGIPLFDLIILGMGEDGHTASIFPGHTELFDSEKVCEVATHPVTHQKRITITGRTINNAENVFFLITGQKKALMVEYLFKKNSTLEDYPASHVTPVYGRLNWYLDKEASSFL